MVSLAFILYFVYIINEAFEKVVIWKYESVGKKYDQKVKRSAFYTLTIIGFVVIVGFCSAVLHVIPSEDDHEIFFIMTWFEDNMLEWADFLSCFHRFSFLFVSFLMQAPSFQLTYLLKHVQYQIGILQILLKNIHQGYENLDELIFDEKFHKEIKNRLIMCCKRQALFLNKTNNIVRQGGGLFVFLFALTGAMLGVGVLLFYYLVRIYFIQNYV